MADTLSHCPNCGTAWPEGVEFCPHCGFQAPDAPAWPPAPTANLSTPLLPPTPRLVTGVVWGDMTLGIGISVVSDFLFCLGLIVIPILYFTLKPQYPVFARGLGYGFLVGVALLLGACGVCFYDLSKSNGL